MLITKYHTYKVTRTWFVKATSTQEAVSVSKQVLHSDVTAERMGAFEPELNGAVKEYHKKKANETTNWVCECGHFEVVTDNNNMGFGCDWSGALVCPNCNRSMNKEEPDAIPV